MKEFTSSAYNQFYVPTEIKLTTATAKMFNCDFVILDDKTQFHFYPKIKPLDSSEHNQLFGRYEKIITEGLQSILGKSKEYVVDVVDDGIVDSNIFASVKDFGSNNEHSRMLVEKLITFVHEKTTQN
tara:strand:- start:8229 stop:8609 length:381 start_codon:yes stop_codon:yes gene_type:complete